MSHSSISQRANDVRQVPRQAKVGDLVFANHLDRMTTLINVDPQAAQSDTVTVTGATDAKTYTIVIDGRNVSFTSGAGSTTTTIAAGIAAAINADPIVRGRVSATSAVAVVTIVALLAGQSYTLTESDAQLTLASVTTAATASAIPFGRMLITDGFIADEVNKQGKLPAAASFTAQVDTLVAAFVALATYYASVTIDGVEYKGTALADTNAATTMTALAGSLNDNLPANTIVATSPGDDLVLTAEVPGAIFQTGFGAGDEGATTPAMSLTSNKGVATALERAAAGISLYSSDEEVTTVGGTAIEYPANAGVKALKNGQVWVENSQTPGEGDPVYVETTAGADVGKFFNTASASRVLLPTSFATWERAARSDSTDNIAALRLAL